MNAEKAVTGDARAIFDLISQYTECGILLPRNLGEIYRNIRDFFVCRDKDGIAGCASLQIVWENLAEVKSLAVEREKWGVGIGTGLVRACVDEARKMHIPTVFVLTRETGFFKKFDFEPIDKSQLPQKVWSDCVMCPKFPDCDEEALRLQVSVDGN